MANQAAKQNALAPEVAVMQTRPPLPPSGLHACKTSEAKQAAKQNALAPELAVMQTRPPLPTFGLHACKAS